MNKDLEMLKSGGKIIVEADKTSNLYQLELYITSEYKAPLDPKNDINRRTGIHAKKLGIEDRMEQYTETSCFITLKDHKENFSSHPKCRLINPAKSNLGKVSKSILEKITSNVKVKTGAHLWKSTGDVITWFKSLKNLKKARFIKFDIQEFYPSITSDLLDRALDYASTMQ